MEKPTDKIEEVSIDNNETEGEILADNQEDHIIEETKDDNSDTMQDDGEEEEKNFGELYEESLKILREGELVNGEIVQISKDFVLVDIGYKSEGQILIEEFIDSEGNLTASVGEKVDVLLEKREGDDGLIILSKEKAAKIKIWDEIKEVYKSDGIIKGEIISRIKGGMTVDVGLQAFLPGSQIDIKPIRDFDSLVGQSLDFKILKYNRRRGNIVLSRRAILEAERMTLKDKTLQTLENGAILEGIVKNITDYGLFIDLGGIDGLLHITDMSWSRVGHPSEMCQVGDNITVKVLNYNRESERVSLGLKQLKPDPWTEASEKYPIDSRITGKVVSLVDYGAFVEVEEGIEGLIHISEMSWTRKVRHPSQILKAGDAVEVVVLNIDAANKRISLGLKQVEQNPWEIIEEKYPVGTIIEGKIKNITDFGIFIGIDEGIDGLIHISDISWIQRIKHPSELYKNGQEIQAVVLSIDEENERFSLGIKQLSLDPWDEAVIKYKPGTRITGPVTNITDFGIFVELEEGIEGLIHISELSKEKGSSSLGKFKLDDVIQAKVLNISRDEKKIGLSIKKLEEVEEKEIYKNYVNNKWEATSSLGDLLLNYQPQTSSADQNPEESTEKGLNEEEPDSNSLDKPEEEETA